MIDKITFDVRDSSSVPARYGLIVVFKPSLHIIDVSIWRIAVASQLSIPENEVVFDSQHEIHKGLHE